MRIKNPAIAQALNRFERAARDHAFRGAYHPGDRIAVEREYEEAKATLILRVNRLLP